MKINKTSDAQKAHENKTAVPPKVLKPRIEQYAAVAFTKVLESLQTSHSTNVGATQGSPSTNSQGTNIQAASLILYLYYLLQEAGSPPSKSVLAKVKAILQQMQKLVSSGKVGQPLLGILQATIKAGGTGASPNVSAILGYLISATPGDSPLEEWLHNVGLPALKHLDPNDFPPGVFSKILMGAFLMVFSDSANFSEDQWVMVALLNFQPEMGGNMQEALAKFMCAYYMKKDTVNGKVDWAEVNSDLTTFRTTMYNFAVRTKMGATVTNFFGPNGPLAKDIALMFPNGATKPGQWPSGWGPVSVVVSLFGNYFDQFCQGEFPQGSSSQTSSSSSGLDMSAIEAEEEALLNESEKRALRDMFSFEDQ